MKQRVPTRQACRRFGFVLLEALLAVAIFALGVLALGRCIAQGVAVERLKAEDARARRVLQNRYAEIEAGAVAVGETKEDLSGAYKGLTLRQTRAPLHKLDEQGRELNNLFVVTLTVDWMSDGSKQSRSMTFYVFPPQS
jgi:hypothetical protein